MSLKLNEVTVTGRITHDIEVKTLPNSDRPAVSFQVAVDDSWYDPDAKREEERTQFISCSLYGPRASGLSKVSPKGKLLFFRGKIASQHWMDKASNTKRSRTYFLVEEWQFVEPPKDAAQRPAPEPKDPITEEPPF